MDHDQALADAACELVGQIIKGLAIGIAAVAVPVGIIAWWVA